MSVAVTTNSRPGPIDVGFCTDVLLSCIDAPAVPSSQGNRELLQHGIGGDAGRIVLLTSDEVAVDEGMRRPGGFGDIPRAGQAEAIFQEPRRVSSKTCL